MRLAVQLYTLRAKLAEDVPGTLRRSPRRAREEVELAGLYDRTAERHARAPGRGRPEGRVRARPARTLRGRAGGRAGGGADARRRDGDRAVGSRRPKTIPPPTRSSRRIVEAGAAVQGRGPRASATTTTRSSSARSTSGAGSSRPAWTSSSTSAGCGSRAATRSPSSSSTPGALLLVHAKDVRPEGDGWLDVVAGDGELDFQAIAAAARGGRREPPRGGARHAVRRPRRGRPPLARDPQGGDRVTDLGVGLSAAARSAASTWTTRRGWTACASSPCADVDAERARRDGARPRPARAHDRGADGRSGRPGRAVPDAARTTTPR